MRAWILAALLAIVAAQTTAQTKPATHNEDVSCKISDRGEDVLNAKTKKPEHHEDEYVVCVLKWDDEVVWNGYLAMGHPATFDEAMDAVKEFRDKKAKELLRKAGKIK